MTFSERLTLWLLGLFHLTPLLLLPLLGQGGVVLDVIASAIFLSAIVGVIYFIWATVAPKKKHHRSVID